MLDYSFLNDKARELLEEIMEFDYGKILEGATKTQSPIEQILWVIIARMLSTSPFHAVPQKPFEISGKKYIVDFAVLSNENPDEVICVVECDGHDYHEKTKEQAARDRSRDRAFQSEGIPIFRFTGSEIHSNPRGCSEELRLFLRKMAAMKE